MGYGRFEADFFRRLVFPADVGRGREIIPDLDDGDPRRTLAGMAFDGELQLLANGARVGAAVDQAGRHRLSLVSRPCDLDGEGVEIWQRRALAHADGDLAYLGMLEDRGRDAFGDRLQQVGRVTFEDL